MGTETVHAFERIHEDHAALAEALNLVGATAEEAESVSMLVDPVRRWANDTLDAAAIEEAHAISPQIRASAAEMGLYGLTIPEKFGGAGFSLVGSGRIIEEIARVDRSVAVSIGLHNGLGLRGMIAYASDDLQAKFLEQMATGELIGAFAATEPGAGSHIAGVKTTGVMDEEDPTLLTVNGEKVYVTNGGFADVFTVLARTPGLGGARRGYSLLFLEKTMEGLEVGREEDKLGIRASSTTGLTFEDLRVSTDRVIGEPGKGLDLMNCILAWGRTLMSAGALGGAKTAYEMAMSHALTRRQFGKPIAEFGQVREKLARMRARIYAMESLVRLTGLLQARHGSDVIWTSTATKIFCSDGAVEIADEAIQIHGGAGFIEEVGVARILRDCRITQIFEGANEVLRFHLAAGALPFAGTEAGAIAGLLPEALKAQGERWDALQARTRTLLSSMAKKYGPRIMEHQLRLAGVADAFTALVALEASLLRAGHALKTASGEEARELTELVTYLTALLAREAEAGLASAEDEAFETAANALSSTEIESARARL
ncbi:MAG: acyl-CoA dehydrogenase family protein [Deltaproteobacteria bacterium]|nr:acyl-CoA dehydrogenase family protein [Deltaproteobacteria bacterium]